MCKSNITARALLLLLLVGRAITAAESRTFETDILADTFGFGPETKRAVDLADLHQGCPARDCIPSIDDPVFVAADAASFLRDDDIVLAIEHGGETRAYPARILNFHEIVNDTIGGDPVAITFCPLCGSGLAFRRVIDGEATELGVSGMLYNSDLVFYDRKTETLWDQVEGKGIVGTMTGTTLHTLPLTMTRWERWRTSHPQTRVLSTDTGFDEDYSVDPYAKYAHSTRIVFPVAGTDERLHPKSVVFGAFIDDRYVAYSEQLLEAEGEFEYRFGNRELVVKLHADGSVSIRDRQSGESFTPTRLFWFAWFAFHPDTEIRITDGS
jgi:hypothetical protein